MGSSKKSSKAQAFTSIKDIFYSIFGIIGLLVVLYILSKVVGLFRGAPKPEILMMPPAVPTLRAPPAVPPLRAT